MIKHGGIKHLADEYTIKNDKKQKVEIMKRSIGLWQLFGFAVTSLGGTLLHFLYEWSGNAVWIAPFSGVNESTWEHMKLLFWPMFIYAVIQSFFFRAKTNFLSIKLRGILLGLILIPTLFYTYNGVIGKSPDWINIAIFFISAAIAYIYETRLFIKDGANPRKTNQKIPFAVLCGIVSVDSAPKVKPERTRKSSSERDFSQTGLSSVIARTE